MSSTQHFVVSGAALASMNSRARFIGASSLAFTDRWTSQKSLFGVGNGIDCFADSAAKAAVEVAGVNSILLSFDRRAAVVGFEQQTSASNFNADDLLAAARCGQ